MQANFEREFRQKEARLAESVKAQSRLSGSPRASLAAGNGQALLVQLQMAEQARSELMQEMARMEREMAALCSQLEAFQKREETEWRDLKRRYDASLVLLEEKANECDELRSDLEDLKALFRRQVDELTSPK